ncbi:MAG: SCO family protein [Rhodoferax sp.]|nr:SCO family protein [Pseudorhodobacter sp.]
MPQMAGVVQDLALRGMAETPVFITVDPKRDTVASLGLALQVYGPIFVGLTGNDAALQVVHRAWQFPVFAGCGRQVFDCDPTHTFR